MRSKTLATWTTTLTLSLALSVDRVAHAGDPATEAAATVQEDARRHFVRGVALYKDGDFRAAVIEFKRAYETAPNATVLYNWGQVCLELRDYACALRTFDKYLKDAEPGADKRPQVEAELVRLRDRTASVQLVAEPEGAEVFVDENSIGRIPLAEVLLVNVGRHVIRMEKAGFLPQSRAIEVAGGEHPRIEMKLTPVLASEPVAARPPPNAQVTDHTAAYVMSGVTLLLAGGAVTTGILALNAKSDFDADLRLVPGDASHIESDRTRMKSLALATDLLVGVSVVSAGVATYLWLSPSKNTSVGLAGPSLRVISHF